MPKRFDIDSPLTTTTTTMRPVPRGAVWLGVISVFVGLTLIAPPLSVLYQANDESRRTAIGGAEQDDVWQILYRTPPLSVPRATYAAVRMTCWAGAANAVLLAGFGLVTARRRELGVRLLGVNAVAHAVLMAAMLWAAARFSAALDHATATRLGSTGHAFGSVVWQGAVWAALPGVVYPVVLFWLTLRHRKYGRRRVRVA
jgi:hypothetical protein